MTHLSSFWSQAARLSGRVDLSLLLKQLDRPETLTLDGLTRAGIALSLAHQLLAGTPLLDPGPHLTLGDVGYPETLARIPFAPPVLFHQGNPGLLTKPMVAIVGARACTSMGKRMAQKLALAVANADGVVVSGLARGIDSAAHSAVPHRTIAVLGQGMACRLYGAQRTLAERILEHGGLLLSEFPPERPASKYTYPQRNRIIAGLSRAVAVVEASQRSGSLITARQAAEAGREVLAVPGHPLQSTSQGCLNLLHQGAGLLTKPEDLLHAAGLEGKTDRSTAALPPNTRGVLDAIDPEADFDQIAANTGMCTVDVSKALMALELAGLIHQLPGDRYSRINS